MGEDVVDIVGAPCHLNVHLFIVDAVAVSSSFGRYNGIKFRVFKSFAGDKANVSAGFNAPGQSLEDVEQTIEFYFFGVGNRTINFRLEGEHGLIMASPETPRGL